ncbi:hypothetical protein ACU4GI_01345 [Cupriavidus basilensis]
MSRYRVPGSIRQYARTARSRGNVVDIHKFRKFRKFHKCQLISLHREEVRRCTPDPAGGAGDHCAAVAAHSSRHTASHCSQRHIAAMTRANH